MIELKRSTASGEELLDVAAPAWSAARAHAIALSPTPLGMLAEVSPYLSRVTGHGELRALELRGLHNGESLSLQLGWDDPTPDVALSDLTDFVDAAAVMFPLAEGANPLTMGASEQPVNMWYWKADQSAPFDVIARGYATSQRRPAAASGLRARGAHSSGRWQLVLQRPLSAPDEDHVVLRPGAPLDLAFALWQGSNAERAGQKSATPSFTSARLAP
jgi:complex iron-sulfur molybdoenzyme family reductase subunit gamma